MATYATNIPALQPLASGADDNGANAIVAGDNLQSADVAAASKQHINRKRLATLDPPLATAIEVVDSKRRKHLVESSNFDGPLPAWAQQIQQKMQQMQLNMQQNMQQIQDDLQRLERRLIREGELSVNRSLRTSHDAIEKVIRLADGAYPDQNRWFPADMTELMSAEGADLSYLTNFYGIDTGGTEAESRALLQRHLGINL